MKQLGITRVATALAAALIVCPGLPSKGSAVAGDFVDTVKRNTAGIVAVGTYQTLRRPPAKLRATGFAVADGSYIVTNAHVLTGQLDTAHKEHWAVFFGDSTRLKSHQVKVIDRDEPHDIALLRLLDGSFPPLRLSSGENVAEGQSVAITGFPLGPILGLYPVTHQGIIAAIKPVTSSRQLTGKAMSVIRSGIEIYQLDITAFPGNSGSPLYDTATGDVVGIVSSVSGRNKKGLIVQPSGITFAIPAKYLRKLLERNNIKF